MLYGAHLLHLPTDAQDATNLHQDYTMHDRIRIKTLSCAALLLSLFSAYAAEFISPAAVAENITLENLRQDGTVLRGTLVNHGGRYIQDIELAITYHWRWRNERNPGPQSPGWATTLRIPESLAPGETLELTYTPERSIASSADGDFFPTATIIGYSEFTRPASSAPAVENDEGAGQSPH